MPERYRNPDDLVDAYRSYYAGEKVAWAEWRYTGEPPWLETYRRRFDVAEIGGSDALEE